MEFGPGFWGPVIASAAVVLGALVAYFVVKGGRRIVAPKPIPGKIKTYACGEEVKPEEVHVDSEQFYSPMRRVFRPFYRFVRPAHSGLLSAYLFWVLVGLFVILVLIAFAFG